VFVFAEYTPPWPGDELFLPGFGEPACVATVDCPWRTIFVADAHRDDGKRFVVRADEKLGAFVELESAIRAVSLQNQTRASHRPAG
jgi:hypothetical protein